MLLAPVLALALQVSAGPIDRAVQAGIDDGVYPGAVVVVGRSDTILYARGFGHFTWSATAAVPSPETTLWDVASLTKVTATLPALMILVERGAVDLDAPVARYLPEFRGEGKRAVTVRHLLAHRSGLRAFLPLNRLAPDADSARRLVLAEPLRTPPGTRVEYSDLNAMLLGWIVERVSGRALDAFVAEEVFEPAGMHDARFRPPRALRERIVPVGLWRGHAIAGEIHDQNAARLGGVAGHAGLYATGTDLARYAQLWLRKGRTADGTQLFREATIEEFTRPGAGLRALGWEMRDTTVTDNTGTRLSPRTYGHTGYTGTSLWIDPAQDLFVVLLTNRVYAPRTGRSISRLKQIRGTVADAAVDVAGVCLVSAEVRVRPGGC